jgi:hypothetical protein
VAGFCEHGNDPSASIRKQVVLVVLDRYEGKLYSPNKFRQNLFDSF